MLRTADFSPRDWNRAPIYTSPGDTGGALVLDFGVLARLASEQEASGAFRISSDGSLAKAPLFIDDLPGAFYRVEAGHPDFTPNLNTSERETLVVMEGALRIVSNAGGFEREDPESARAVMSPGDVVELSDESISMQSVYLVDPAKCLALAMYRDYDGRVPRDLKLQ
jgi:hypothetical protein